MSSAFFEPVLHTRWNRSDSGEFYCNSQEGPNHAVSEQEKFRANRNPVR